jgi:polyphosphate kinase 2 (PPK2 family)
LWDDYRAAYEEMLERCSTDHAPWYVIPSNRKWYRNLAIARIIADTLEEMAPQFPPPEAGLEEIVIGD